MRLKKKCSNILKLIMLTLLVSVALSFSVSLATSDITPQIDVQDIDTSAVGAGGVPGKMELDTRADSIWRTNLDNPQYSPVYCMFHKRSLTYFNRPGGGGSGSSVSSSASSSAVGTQSTAPTMSVAQTLNNFLSMVKQLPSNDTVKRDVTVTPGETDDSVIISGETYLDLTDAAPDAFPRTTKALTWSEYLLQYALSNAEIEPSCGYAIYYLINVAGINPTQVFRMDFQYVIWSSRNFGNDSNMLDPGSPRHLSGPSMGNDVQSRAHQFGQVYYEILQYDKANPNSMFTITPNDPDTPDDTLKVMIDKTTRLYTVGPYNMKCNYGSTQAKQILYNEITGRGNKGFVAKVRFAEYLGIVNLNYVGDIPDVEYLRKDGTKFVEGEGTTNFPDFVTEEDFYIRFKPTEDGAINRLSEKLDDLNPVIRVEYISQIDTDVRAKYESTELQAHEVHGIFQGGQPLSGSMVDWFRALTDKSSLPPVECSYKADSVSWTKPTEYTIGQHLTVPTQRIDGVTDITFTFTFSGTSGSQTVQVTFLDVPVYQILASNGTDCHAWDEDNGGCIYSDFLFPDPPPDNWLLTGSDTEASDIIVNGVLLQTIAKLVVNRDVELHKNVTEVKVGGKRINMQLGGYVWLDAGDAKTADFDNLRDTRSQQEHNNNIPSTPTPIGPSNPSNPSATLGGTREQVYSYSESQRTGYQYKINVGNVSYTSYYQTRGDYKYDRFNDGTTIYDVGCGVTSVSILLSGYGVDLNPRQVLKEGNGVSRMGTIMRNHGVAGNWYNDRSQQEYISRMDQALSEGKPVIVCVKPKATTFWTTWQHYMVVVGRDENYLYICDPAHPDDAHQLYTGGMQGLARDMASIYVPDEAPAGALVSQTPEPSPTPEPTETPKEDEETQATLDAYFKDFSYRGFWDTPNNNDKNFNGILVELYDKQKDPTTPIAYTTTDKFGRYRFYGLAEDPGENMVRSILNPLHDYFVKFKFNGQLYTQVESNNDGKYAKWTSGGEGKNSSADEITGQGGESAEDTPFSRKTINGRFETIKSLYDGGTPSAGADNNSYEGTEGENKAFAMYQKLETAYGTFSDQARLDGENPKYVHGYGDYLEKWAYAYGDAWDDFIYQATNTTNFENPDYMDCTKVWFDGNYKASDDVYVRKMEEVKGKWGYDAEYVKKFINDCLMKAKTISPTYTISGDYDKFIINNVNEQLVEKAPLYDPEIADTYWATFKNLYTQESDQSRYVNYGVHERQRADLAVQKDVFNAKVVVDGELETYDYRSKNMEAQASDEAYDPAKDETTWNIYKRREEILYKLHQENGTDRKSGETAFVHPLEIRRSDYLKTWTETAELDKNLKILITYRIAVKNQGSVPVVINDLIDYYDSDEMEFDGVLNGDTYTPTTYKKYSEDGAGTVTEQYVNTYISSKMNGTNEGNLTVKTTGYDGRSARTLAGQQIDSGLSNEYKYYYDTLFLSGLNGGAALEPGKITFAYVSFRVKNPEVTRFKYSKIKDKPILDITFDEESNLVGKRNIIEVNSYSTPQNGDDTINYGFVDIDSCAGSLDDNDLNQETGNIKVNNNPLEDHQEDDTDEAPNLRIRVSTNDDTRVYTGYAYEDNRNEIKDKAVVGDGEYTDDETKIDGITMQIYQLQRDVDSEGIFTGKYEASAKRLQQYRFTAQDESTVGLIETITDPRYATGSGEANILFDSDIPALKIGELPINLADLAKGTGGYAFASIPSGDYFIRFIYGDTYETVLTSDETDIGKEVKDLIGPMTYTQSQEGVVLKPTNATDNTASTGTATIEAKGLNIKSYNGQDYKSTVYQGLDTGKAIDQSDIYYNGISGYGYGAGGVEQSYDTQNYSYVANGDYNNLDYATYQDYVKLNDDGNKRELMHYYDIQKGDEGAAGLSDAKDVYYYRWKANNYGRGTQFDTNSQKTQRNTLMEILDSWEKLQTYQEGNVKERQENMLKELMEQTQMVSQTGIISTRGEYNTTTTNGQGYESGVNNIDKDTHEHGYVLKNLNLGLVERPEAQLKLTKKITNFQVTLANGRVLFDASKSVRNLYMAEHKGHMTFFANKDIRTDKQSDIDYKYPYWSDMTNNKTPVDPSNPDGVTQGQEALRKEKENLYNKLGNEQELRRLAAVVTSANSKETPELLQVYMDDELMEGAMMRVRYDFLVENAGEVDYLDKQFYYTGRTAHPGLDAERNNNPAIARVTDAEGNYVSRTNAYTVVDYVTNMIRYDQQYQDQKNGNPIVWSAKNLNDLINSSTVDTSGNVSIGNNGTGLDDGNGNITANDPTSFRRDLVNRKYAPIVKTYNQILTTDSLRDNTIETSLLPIKYFTNKGEAETEGRGVHRTTLILSTELSTNNTGDNLVYNNLTELVETQNSVGRRMQYSIIGNQSMSDQSLRNDTSITEDSSEDLITPKEIDADSAQKIVITKPTGEFRDYTPWIITAISALAIIVVGAVIIVKKVLGNKTE